MDNLASDLFSTELNLKELDGKPCNWCGIVPEIKWIDRETNGRFLPRKQQYMDRTSRIDCDAAVKKQQSRLMTYHVKCWMQACLNYYEPTL